MAAIRRSLDFSGYVSDEARHRLGRAARTLRGLLLLALSVALAVALATWSVGDPSLTHATTAPETAISEVNDSSSVLRSMRAATRLIDRLVSTANTPEMAMP